MSTYALPQQEALTKSSAPTEYNYLTTDNSIRSWLLTQDHKRIAILYLVGVTFFVIVGGLLAMALRMELSPPGSDLMAMDTYNKVFTMHGVVMVFLAGLHFWWPKITGRMYPKPRKVAAVLIFVGFFFTFGPQFILGYMGMPRRYAMYPPEWQFLNVMSTAGATVMGFGYLVTMLHFAWSLKYGKIATKNPWNAYGLEWTVASPPPTENFKTTPIVTHEAYDYEWLDHGKPHQTTTAIAAD